MLKRTLSLVLLLGAMQVSAYTLEPPSTLELVVGGSVEPNTHPEIPRNAFATASASSCLGTPGSSTVPGRNCRPAANAAPGWTGDEASPGVTGHQSLLVVSLLAGIAVGFLAIRR